MLYLSNTNRQESIDNRRTGGRGGVPFARVNWSYEEVDSPTGGGNVPGILTISGSYESRDYLVTATDTSNSTITLFPATPLSASLTSNGAWPRVGSISMSLEVSGSDGFYYVASSSVSSSILMTRFTGSQSATYDVNGIVGYISGCATPWLAPSASCGNLLDYTFSSVDFDNQKWYPTNNEGLYTTSSSTAGTITGSLEPLNASTTAGCAYPGVYFSGSATFPISATGVYLGIVTGSFTLEGSFNVGLDVYNWSLSSIYTNTGSVNLQFDTNGGGAATDYTYNAETTKNSLVGFQLDSYTGPFGERAVTYAVSGSLISYNPPVTSQGFPLQLGTSVTLSGVGIIRAFGFESGSAAQQTEYNCLYSTTPSK